MTPEEEIDIEIASSILNEYIAKLAHRRAGIEKDITKAREVQMLLTPEDAKRIIEANEVNNPRKIELAPQELCDEYSQEIDELLICLGHPEALVTDLSSLGDFLEDTECEAARRVLDLLERTFGEQQMLVLTDKLVSLAKAIRRGRDGRR